MRRLGYLAAPFPISSDADIEAAIQRYPNGRLCSIARVSDPFGNILCLAIKCMPVKCAEGYRSGRVKQFHISSTVGYAWGAGTYVAPLAYPISSAIFGRLGVVARFDPSKWRVFDEEPESVSLVGMAPAVVPQLVDAREKLRLL